MSLFRILPALLLGVVWSTAARAHDPGISTAEVKVLADRIEIVTGFAPDDARQLLPRSERGDERWAEDNFAEVERSLLSVAREWWAIEEGAGRLAVRDARVQLVSGDNVSFFLVYPKAADARTLRLRAPRLGELPAGHRQFVIVADAGGFTLTKKLLRAEDAAIDVTLPGAGANGGGSAATATAGADVGVGEREGQRTLQRGAGETEREGREDGAGADATTFWGFLRLGVEHIWTGYDHLLFLLALLIVCRTFRAIVGIVSCFTVAHSITLGVATLGWVNLPARWVEPAIAASIVFVGVENLVRRGEQPRGRGALTFVFGLVHGFGFASVLRDLGVGARGGDGVAMPLLSFNLGVELGQIVVAAVVMPLIWRLRREPWFVGRGVTAISALVAVAGLFWLGERTLR